MTPFSSILCADCAGSFARRYSVTRQTETAVKISCRVCGRITDANVYVISEKEVCNEKIHSRPCGD